MSNGQGWSARASGLRTTRMEAFSDGVFAIAITLLVLEIGVPEGSEADLWGAIVDEWPSYLAYLVSFGTIGVVWLEHTVVTEYLDHATSALVRLNLLLLLVVSVLPFTTGLLAEYVGEESSARVAVTVYGVNLFVVSVMVSLLWRYVLREGLVRPDADESDVRMLTKRLTPGLAGYVAVIVAGLFVPVVAVFGYLAIAVYFLIPWHAIRGRTEVRS